MTDVLKHDPASCERVPCGRCRPSKPPSPPVIARNPHDAAVPPIPPDAAVASIGLPRHPTPFEIAGVLEDTAKALRRDGSRAIDLARVLAARGYAASTLGDGGSRGTDATSSTERQAQRAVPGLDSRGKPLPLPPDAKWYGADRTYAQSLRDIWRLSLTLTASTSEIVRHADTTDPTPAGTGACRACERVCRPTKERPNNRLRSGLCPTCYRAWLAYMKQGGGQLWSDWVGRRRESYTERDSVGGLVAIHTPEPDHDA